MLDRTVVPKFYSPKYKPFDVPTKSLLSNGLSVYYSNSGDQEVFKLEINFSGGSSAAINPAIPTLCIAMLREGSKSMSAIEINSTLDYYGAFLDMKSGIDSTTINLYGRSAYIAKLIPILAEIIFEPVFKEEALDKHKKKMIQNLLINQDKTSYWAPRLLRKSLFGEDHPYSKVLTVDGIESITKEEVINYHQEFLKLGLRHIFFSGAFDKNSVQNLLENHFSEHPLSAPYSIKNKSNNEKGGMLVKELSGTSQASIALGIHSLSIADSKYSSFAFLTKILGGYFGSRLMKKLREEEGLTYGIHAYNVHLQAGSYLQISSDVELSSVDKSIDLIYKEIEHLRDNPISAEEANTVKNYMIGEFVNDSNTVFDFSDLYKSLVVHELPEEYYQVFYEGISTIDSGEVQRLATEYLTTNEFSVVKVM